MRTGRRHRFGEVVLSKVQYTDTFEIKKRPALVLFEEKGNVVVIGITSNIKMQGIPLTRREGAIKESIIKLNYTFSISERMIEKPYSQLQEKKRTGLSKS